MDNPSLTPDGGNEQKTLSQYIYSEVCDWAETFAVALAILVAVFLFAVRYVTVDGTSMTNTLQNKDRLIIVNGYGNYKTGDIVVVRVPGQAEPYIKRVIATEGQTVDIDFETGEVSVDGTVLQEDYINALTTVDGGVHFPLTVAEGCIFVLGDNRGISKDSRYPDVGQIDKREVLGKAIFLMYPGTDDGTYPREFDRVGAIQ